jgi:hypothetical protein
MAVVSLSTNANAHGLNPPLPAFSKLFQTESREALAVLSDSYIDGWYNVIFQ